MSERTREFWMIRCVPWDAAKVIAHEFNEEKHARQWILANRKKIREGYIGAVSIQHVRETILSEELIGGGGEASV